MRDSDIFKKAPIQPSGKAEKASDQALAKLDDMNFQAEFFPSAIKGEGHYVIETTTTFFRSKLTAIGMDEEVAKALQAQRAYQWRVSPETMEQVVPGAMQMTPEELTAEIRKIAGHEHTTVHNLRSHGDEMVVMTVGGKVSRSTFAGEGGDKDKVKVYNLYQKHIIVPEKIMHQALGVGDDISIA